MIFLEKLKKYLLRYFIWAIFIIAATLCCFIFEPWFDEYHVYDMVVNGSVSDVRYAMPREGHFCLWHLLVMPFAKMTHSIYCVYMVSVPLMAIASWLLLFKSPFKTWINIIILLSYPVLYYFSAVSRCYALIPPILFMLAFLYKDLPRHKYLYCFLVGLLANTHAYMEGMVAALFFLYLYEHVWLCKDWSSRKKNLWPSFVTIFMVIAAFLQIAKELIKNETGLAGEKVSTLKVTISQLSISYGNLLNISSSNFVVYLGYFFLVLLSILAIINICFYKKRYTLALLVSILWQIMFSCKIYYMFWQRLYLPFYVLLFFSWLYLDINHKLKNKYWQYAFVLLLCVMSSSTGYYNIYHTVRDTKTMADDLSNTIGPKERIYVPEANLGCKPPYTFSDFILKGCSKDLKITYCDCVPYNYFAKPLKEHKAESAKRIINEAKEMSFYLLIFPEIDVIDDMPAKMEKVKSYPLSTLYRVTKPCSNIDSK